jgi:hypothetical protein
MFFTIYFSSILFGAPAATRGDFPFLRLLGFEYFTRLDGLKTTGSGFSFSIAVSSSAGWRGPPLPTLDGASANRGSTGIPSRTSFS